VTGPGTEGGGEVAGAAVSRELVPKGRVLPAPDLPGPPPRQSRLDRARARALAEYGNWRMLLMRIILNGCAVTITALVLPGIHANWRPGGFVIAGVVFGVLNALVKPALQFLLLPAIFATYGTVVAFVNGLLLLVLDRITGGLIEIDGVLPFFTGGAVVGVIGLLLEHLLGLSPPIVDTAARRRQGA